MQDFLAKHKFLLALIFCYFLLRLINLTLIPIFNDESIYLDWGWKAFHGTGVFNSLGDGKQPLMTWLFAIAEGMLSDPLFAGRVVSVLAGCFTLWGLFRLGKEVFNENIGRLSALLYILIPLFSFFDRQALMESGVAATGVWTVYLLLRLLKARSIKTAIALGVVVGLGFFIKSTILLLIVAIAVVYVVAVRFRQENKLFLRDVLIAFGVSQLVLLPLYLQPLFWQNLSMNDRYSMGLGELIRFPLAVWLSNVWALLQIAFWHLTPLVFFAVIVSIVLLLRAGKKEQKILIWIFLIQAFFFVLVARTINPRYAMPMLPLAALFVAFLITYYKKWSTALAVVLAIVPLYFLLLQLFAPLQYFDQLQALTAHSQKEAYVTNFTAGYAATQAIQYIQSTNVPVAMVAVRIDAGNPENTIYTYFHNSPTRVPRTLDAHMLANPSSYQCLTYRVPVYFVSRDTQLAGLDNFLQEETRFYNPEHHSSVGVYHFKYPCTGNTLDLGTPGAISMPGQIH